MAFNQTSDRTYSSLTDDFHALTDYEISSNQNQINTRPYNWVGQYPRQNSSVHASQAHSHTSAPTLEMEGILKSATHFALMGAGNEAHIHLFDNYMRVKYQLEAQNDRVSELKDRISELKGELKEVQKTAKTDRQIDDEDIPVRKRTLEEVSIIIPPAPPSAEKDDYPDVRYWAKTDWTEYCKRARLRNEVPDKFGFLCDESGEKITSQRLEEISKSATMAWNDLYYWRLDPETWAKKIDQAMKYFSSTMAHKYPEFRWCHGDWKAQEFATQRYPGWNRYHRQSGQLKRRVPSMAKRKMDDINDNNDSAPKVKKRRRIKALLRDCDIINLDSEDESPPDPPSSLTGSTPPEKAASSRATLPASGKSPATTFASLSTPSDITTIPVASSSDLSHSAESTCRPEPPAHPPASAAPYEVTPAPNSEANSTLEATVEATHTNEETHTIKITQTVKINQTDETQPIETTHEATNSVEASPMAPTVEETHTIKATVEATRVLGNDARATRSSRQVLMNPLASLSIPPPPHEVQVQTNIQPAVQKVPAKLKKSKVMEPSKTSTTARNLYAIFYKKTHPNVTEAEFKEVYKQLDKETVKQYEAQGKKMKTTAGKTAASAAQDGSGESTNSRDGKALEGAGQGNSISHR